MIYSTESEEVFASYLEERKLEFSYEDTLGTRHPDFWVKDGQSKVVFEVKQIEAEPPRNRVGAINPYQKLKTAIRDKAKQGRELKGQFPFVIVFCKHWFWPIDPSTVPGAMFGAIAITMPFDATEGKASLDRSGISFGQGATLQPERNRVVSAVAVVDRLNPTQKLLDEELDRRLADVEGRQEKTEVILNAYRELTEQGIYSPDLLRPWLRVFHNPYATLPVSEALFDGPFHHGSPASEN